MCFVLREIVKLSKLAAFFNKMCLINTNTQQKKQQGVSFFSGSTRHRFSEREFPIFHAQNVDHVPKYPNLFLLHHKFLSVTLSLKTFHFADDTNGVHLGRVEIFQLDGRSKMVARVHKESHSLAARVRKMHCSNEISQVKQSAQLFDSGSRWRFS